MAGESMEFHHGIPPFSMIVPIFVHSKRHLIAGISMMCPVFIGGFYDLPSVYRRFLSFAQCLSGILLSRFMTPEGIWLFNQALLQLMPQLLVDVGHQWIYGDVCNVAPNKLEYNPNDYGYTHLLL
jgi:hypothetical protein